MNRHVAIAGFIVAATSVAGCAPEYRYEDTNPTPSLGAMADRPASETVKSVVVTVFSTGDNKDRDLKWEVEVRGNNVIYGETEVGLNDEWRTGQSVEIVVNLTVPFSYSDRKTVQVMVMQKPTGNNDHGWRGALAANAVMADDSVRKLLDRSQEFNLGERNNSKTLSLSFQ